MLSKQSLKLFKLKAFFNNGSSSIQDSMIQRTLCHFPRSLGRLSRVNDGPKFARAAKKVSPIHPPKPAHSIRENEQWRSVSPTRSETALPRGYQLKKMLGKAAQIAQTLKISTAPAEPQTSDPFGSPTIYRAPGLRGGDSKFACACFRPVERTTSWGLADHIRRREAEAVGVSIQWPPVIHQPMDPVPFDLLCQYCRKDFEDGHSTPETGSVVELDMVDMVNSVEYVLDVNMVDTDSIDVDIEMEDAPEQSTYTKDEKHRSIEMADAPTLSSREPWYSPCLQGAIGSQQQPPQPQVPVTGQFAVFDGHPADPWAKRLWPRQTPEPRPDTKREPSILHTQHLKRPSRSSEYAQSARPPHSIGLSRSQSVHTSRFAPKTSSKLTNSCMLTYDDDDDDLSGDEGLDLTPPRL